MAVINRRKGLETPCIRHSVRTTPPAICTILHREKSEADVREARFASLLYKEAAWLNHRRSKSLATIYCISRVNM
jgi:hypothetical protein